MILPAIIVGAIIAVWVLSVTDVVAILKQEGHITLKRAVGRCTDIGGCVGGDCVDGGGSAPVWLLVWLRC
jgi:hypothetical protein